MNKPVSKFSLELSQPLTLQSPDLQALFLDRLLEYVARHLHEHSPQTN